MSPRRNVGMRIALPPRLMSFNGRESALVSPCSTAPHTPMPYEMVTTPDGISQQYHDMRFDDLESVSSTGSKRGRDEVDEEEASWTEADMTAMQNVLVHPFRPLSTPFPPGELPPPNVLDDLTHQLVKYAYRPSPSKRSSRKPPPVQTNEDGWTHTWEATRRKLFRLALAESQEAHGQSPEGRKLPRNERIQRPGLKRMDSMDFLDEGEDESTESDQIGRALRLSTTLQNSSKHGPLGALTRSTSDDVTTTFSSMSSGLESPPILEAPVVPAAITITPSSPAAAPPLPRRGSGSSRMSSRTSRPSLLQRGRSFTASDLEADIGILASPTAPGRADAPPRNDRSQSPTPISSEKLSTRRDEPKLLTIPAYVPSSSASRLTRSQSNEVNLNAHAAQKSFCAPRQPTTHERAVLALPFESSPSSRSVKKTSNGWSDSEDEGASTAVRHVKKAKPVRASRQTPSLAMPFQPLIQGDLLGSSALRSPFEEKIEIRF